MSSKPQTALSWLLLLEDKLPDGVLCGAGGKKLHTESLYPGTRPGSNMAFESVQVGDVLELCTCLYKNIV